MAVTISTPSTAPRNLFFGLPAGVGRWRYPRTSGSPTTPLDGEQHAGLLACIERDGGVTPTQDISKTRPTVERPLRALFDLCDARTLRNNLETAFDGDMRLWRTDR